jgi:hypothetical protein
MGGETTLVGAPLVFALELVVLYAAGSYATTGLLGPVSSRGGGLLRRVVFYLVVFPGVVLHEGAHYLACLLTGTRVVRFAPFSPRRLADGRLMLGYVRHEDRPFPIRAIIGLAPLLINPLGLLLVTALLTPMTLREVVSPRFGTFAEDVLASGFLAGNPLLAAVWAYLALSFALGSVPSREDLASVPAALLLFVVGVVLVAAFSESAGAGLAAAASDLATLAAGLYALPAAVAAIAAMATGLWGRTFRG